MHPLGVVVAEIYMTELLMRIRKAHQELNVQVVYTGKEWWILYDGEVVQEGELRDLASLMAGHCDECRAVWEKLPPLELGLSKETCEEFEMQLCDVLKYCAPHSQISFEICDGYRGWGIFDENEEPYYADVRSLLQLTEDVKECAMLENKFMAASH